MKPTVVLYKPALGTVVENNGHFMEKFLSGIACSTDFGFMKKQYIIDTTFGADQFDDKEYKDHGITVVSMKEMDKTLTTIGSDSQKTRNRQNENGGLDLPALNAKLKDRLPYTVLHIVVPERSQTDNAARLLSDIFKQLLRASSAAADILPIFYVSEKEWAVRDNPDDGKQKEEDFIYFIRTLSGLNQQEYQINNENATLTVH
jgi:hypothetical protein